MWQYLVESPSKNEAYPIFFASGAIILATILCYLHSFEASKKILSSEPSAVLYRVVLLKTRNNAFCRKR